MLQFFEKTWFLWWLVATFAILKWFHTISSGGDLEAERDRLNAERHSRMPDVPRGHSAPGISSQKRTSATTASA
jgi:hypothetical protein